MITSLTNPFVKKLRSLHTKKGRRDTRLFLCEGMRLIQEGLANGWRVDSLLVSNKALERPSAAQLIEQVKLAGARVEFCSDSVLQKVSKKDNPAQLVAAFEQQAQEISRLIPGNAPLWLGLYQVRDPGNLGTIIRSCDAAGIDGVLMIGACCDLYAIETIRATMGSLFAIPVIQLDAEAAFQWIKANNITTYAGSLNGKQRHDEASYEDASLIMMGNEQSGLPDEVEARLDKLIKLPMRPGADSLNLASATAVMIYEAWRQRGFKGAEGIK